MIPWTWCVATAVVILGFAAWVCDYLNKRVEVDAMNMPFKMVTGAADTVSSAAQDYYEREKLYFCARRPKRVNIGAYQIWAGGRMFFTPADLNGHDLLVPLTQYMCFAAGQRYQIFALPLEDFGGVRAGYKQHVEEIARELASGKNILVFCDGGLGRTGTLLASLIALMEPETKDPIAAVRERYREFAIETYAQAEAVFALRGQKAPEQYRILLDVEQLRRAVWLAPKPQ